MSGLENILAKLQADAQKECENIARGAEISAQKALDAANAQAQNIIELARKEAALQEQKLLAKAEASANAAGRQILLAEKIRLIDDTLSLAKRALHDLNDTDYCNVLFAFAARARQKGAGIMFLNAKDLARLPKDFSQKLGEEIEISSAPIDIEDGFILKYGDIEMNCTFDAMFTAYREELKAKAAEILFG